MKTWFYLAVILLAVACNAEKSQEQRNQIVTTTIHDCSQAKDTAYAYSISTELYNIHVYAIQHPGTQELVVHTDDGNVMLAEIRRPLPGTILKVNTGDLNQNNQPELYIWCRTSEDSCALLAFEMRGSDYMELMVPTPGQPVQLDYELTSSGIIAQTKNTSTHYKLTGNGGFEKV